MLFVTCLAFVTMAQNVTGKVVDAETGEALIGASVAVQGTTVGTITDIDGSFALSLDGQSNKTLEIGYLGYATMLVDAMNGGDLGMISMAPSIAGLEEVVITGVVDIVKERKTPVAASTIKARDIQLKLGNQEFPEIMKTTPSIYATKQGGGYGDGRINVRGFNQRNVSVIINGQPVNDMENGWVYWSNWAGLQSVASGVEIQRGIGASKLAVPSVGGTINIVTRAADREKGGFVNVGVGNDGYLKTTLSYSSGKSDNGWSSSVLLGRWQGNGYVDGTKGEGYNYLFALGYEPSENHNINFTYTGAAQWHHQRSAWISIRDYKNYGGDDFRRLNFDWGMKDGEEYTYRRNFYNKPIATVNYDWKISDNLKLSNALYGSWGRGGGTGPRGRNFGIYPFRKDMTEAFEGLDYRNADATINFDAIVANNKAGTPYDGTIFERAFKDRIIGSNTKNGPETINTNASIRRSSVNSHNWYGLISNLEYNKNEWTFAAGVDGRTYTGLHYRVVNDLLGLDGYYSTGNRNSAGQIITETSKANPFADISSSPKIAYYNIGKVGWLGLNGLVEYSKDAFTGVIQAGVSNQSYKRIDYFSQNPAESERHSQTGGFIKGGVNYNINAQHNVFANAGYISKQPIFDAIFPNFANTINEEVENEEIVSYELGYGFRSNNLRAKLNLYSTSWGNRFLSTGVDLGGGNEGTATFSNLKNVHNGVELELTYDVMDNLTLKGMASLGDWSYNGDVASAVFDEDQKEIGTSTLYLSDVKVGDAAQTTFNLGADYKITDGLSIDATWLYFDNLYADFNVLDSEFLNKDNRGSVKLPSYNLADLGVTYRLPIASNFMTLRFNVNNLFDTEYISESKTNIHVGDGDTAVNGINDRNYVWYGFGRTWNASVKYNF